jgi:hypothetical protein
VVQYLLVQPITFTSELSRRHWSLAVPVEAYPFTKVHHQISRMATLIPRGYRSATEFCFDKEQTDAIIRTTAYHRKDYCLSVIWFSHREHHDIHPSIATPFQWTSSAGLGSLDQLPLELLLDTLYRLDMHSCSNFDR